MRQLAVLVASACLAFVAAPAADAHYVSWSDLRNHIERSNWGGACGAYPYPSVFCRDHYRYDWQSPTGSHSRWVQGGFYENWVWSGWKWCNIMTRFYHFDVGEHAYKSCR